MTAESLEARVALFEADIDIRASATQYCFAIDDRDLDTVARLLLPDTRVWSEDGVMDAVGVDSSIELYKGRYASLGATNRVMHDHLIVHKAQDQARARVSAHAEVLRNETALVAALRYSDRYERVGGQWRFRERKLSFLYYRSVHVYGRALGRVLRMRAHGNARPADHPERLPTWREYR